MKPFSELTGAGRLRRLRRLALAALPRFDVTPRRVRLLSGSFNAIYRVDGDDGRKRAARVHVKGYRDRAALVAEARFLRALHRDGRIAVPEPIATPAGDDVVRVDAPGVPDGRLVTLLGWVAGVPLARRCLPRDVMAYGRAAAVLHDVASDLGHTALPGLPLADGLFSDGPNLMLSHPDIAGTERQPLFAQAVAIADAAWSELAATAGQPIPIHGDLHLHNAHVDRAGRIAVLDFDDAVLGWPGLDLAISHFYIARAHHDPAVGAAAWDAFARGYRQHRPWPIDERALLDLSLARQLVIVNTLLRLDGDSTEAAAGPYIDKATARLRQWLQERP